MQEPQVRSLGREDPLEKEMAAHSSLLAWRIPWTEEPGGLQYMESRRVGLDLGTKQQQQIVQQLQQIVECSKSSILRLKKWCACWKHVIETTVDWLR